MILEDISNQDIPVQYAPCETIVCRFCGNEYPSRGKHDPGYCQACEQKMIEGSAVFIGGPLDGQRVSGISDNS